MLFRKNGEVVITLSLFTQKSPLFNQNGFQRRGRRKEWSDVSIDFYNDDRHGSPQGGFQRAVYHGLFYVVIYRFTPFLRDETQEKKGVLMSQEKGSTYIRTHTAHYYWSWGAGKIAVRFMASSWISYLLAFNSNGSSQPLHLLSRDCTYFFAKAEKDIAVANFRKNLLLFCNVLYYVLVSPLCYILHVSCTLLNIWVKKNYPNKKFLRSRCIRSLQKCYAL